MAKKITQYPASGGNPNVGSLIDISELSGGVYTTKKLTIQQLLDYLTANLNVGQTQLFRNNTGATITAGTPCELLNTSVTSIPTIQKIRPSFQTGLSKIYIATTDVLNGANGNFVESGIVSYNTSMYPVGTKLYYDTTGLNYTDNDLLEDQVFLGIVLTQNVNGSIFFAPTRSPQLIKGVNGQIPLFNGVRKINGNTHFTFVDVNGTEVGFRFSDNNNNLTQVGVTYLNVESEGIASNSVLRLANWADNANKGIVSFRKSRGSKATPTKVLVQDVLGSMIFAGQSDKTFNGGAPFPSGMTTGEIVVRALNNFVKNYDSFADETFSQGLTQFEIWLQESNAFAYGDNTPPTAKVFSVDGDGKVSFKTYTFPINAGTNGQVLSIVSAGQLGWTTPSSSAVTIPSTRIPFGSSGNLLTTDTDFCYFEDSNTSSLYDRSAIQLSSNQIDHNGLVKFGAVQWLMESTASLWGQLRKNPTTNLGSGAVLRLGSLDQSLAGNFYALIDQLWGEIQFGYDSFRVGASIKSYTEQGVTGMAGSGSRLEFYVTPINSTTPARAMKIDNTGKIYFKNYNFPLADGTAGQTLVTDASGNLTWQTLSSGGISGAGSADRVAFWSSASVLSYDNNFVRGIYGGNSYIQLLGSMGDVEINRGDGSVSQYSNSNCTTILSSYGTGVQGVLQFRRYRGNKSAPTAFLSGDAVGSLQFQMVECMKVVASESSSTGYGNYVIFSTGVPTTLTQQEVIRLKDDGKLRIGNSYDMPKVDGTPNQLMATNGLGQISFVNDLSPITQDKWALPNSAQLRGMMYNPLVTTFQTFGGNAPTETGTKTAKTPTAGSELSKKISCKLAVSTSQTNGSCAIRGGGINYFRENGLLFSCGFAVSDTGYNPSSSMFVGLSYLSFLSFSFGSPATIGNSLWNSLSFVGVGNDGYSASFTGSCTGTTLTVSAITYGTLEVGQSFSTATTGTKILSQLSGTTGGVGTYQLSISQTITNSTMRAFDMNLCIVSNDASGNATKFKLGDNFPANRLAGAVNTNNFYVFEMYSGIDANEMSWRIRNTGIANSVQEGTITTNLPALGVPLNFQLMRNSMGDSNACSVDVSHLYCSNLS